MFCLFLGSLSAHAQDEITAEAKDAIWAKAAPHYPLKDLGLRAPEAKPNVEGDEVNAFLEKETTCRFYGYGSNSVIERRVKPSDRLKVVASAEGMLSECQTIKKELGPKACSSIEIAGHADRVSIGLSLYIGNDRYPTVFGINHHSSKRDVVPNNLALMKEIGACLREISEDGAPVIFSTCGADKDKQTGEWLFYPGKPTAQAELAKLIDRPVISAIGPASSDGLGTYSRFGWLKSEPTKDIAVTRPLSQPTRTAAHR